MQLPVLDWGLSVNQTKRGWHDNPVVGFVKRQFKLTKTLIDDPLPADNGLSSTYNVFSTVQNSCSARGWSSALQQRTEHIPPKQKESNPARLPSGITAQWRLLLGKTKTSWNIGADRSSTCLRSGTGSSLSSFESSSHSSTRRAASYCGPYSTGKTSWKHGSVSGGFFFPFIQILQMCLTWKK